MSGEGLVLVTAPAVEPVTLQEAKDQCRVDLGRDDALIDRLIIMAREHVEEQLGRALITQTWDWSLDWFDHNMLCRVPKPPLRSVDQITYVDLDGNSQTLATSIYQVDTTRQLGRIAEAYGQTFPSTRDQFNAVTIRITVGYGATGTLVPARYTQAMLEVIAQLYKHREDIVTGKTIAEIPLSVPRLLNPSVAWR